MDDIIDQLAESLIAYIEAKRDMETLNKESEGHDPTLESGRQFSAMIDRRGEAYHWLASTVNEIIYRRLLEYGLLSPEDVER